jgi:hypothetical protein
MAPRRWATAPSTYPPPSRGTLSGPPGAKDPGRDRGSLDATKNQTKNQVFAYHDPSAT